MIKRISLVVAVFVVASLFWYFAQAWISNPTFALAASNSWAVPVVGLIIFAAVLGLAFALLDTLLWRMGAALAASLPFLLFIGFSLMHSVAVLMMLVLMYFAAGAIHQELKARITINGKRVVGAGLGTIMTALLLAVSFGYYLNPMVQASAKSGKLPVALTNAVKSAAQTYVASQLTQVPPDQRAGIERQVVQEVLNQVNALLRPYVKYLPPILAFGLFLLLEGFNFIFLPLASLVAVGIFAALRASGFIIIETKSVQAETLRI